MTRLSAAIMLLLLLVSCQKQEHFSVDVLNRYTPVKQQGGEQLCWVYAMLAAIETEHIMRGDSVELSAAWVAHWLQRDSLAPSSGRGVAMTAISLIERHGLVPHQAMPADDSLPPRWAFMYGEQYTPLEFAHSVCAPGEYVALGSSTDHPYFSDYEMSSPDNWMHHRLRNLPPDSLLQAARRAVEAHRGACWEGDISEPGFNWPEGVARTSLFQGSTTDDHCMAIVGLAHDDRGQPYFIMKNSWGTRNAFGGLLYMSFDYFRAKTMAVVLPRDAI